MKLDTLLMGGVAGAAESARRFEELGLDGVFTFEGPQDAYLPLAVAAHETSLDVYTSVALAFPRSPMVTAYQAWDLQTLAEGRFMLGLGTQIRANIEDRYGAEFSRPVARMRDYVGALRAIFATWHEGERLDFQGDFYRHTLMQPTFNPGPHPFGPPPILLGALGPRMTRLACEVADGIFVHPFSTERHLTDVCFPLIEEGLSTAGRDAAGFTTVCDVIVATGRTEEEMAAADAGARMLLSFYGSTPAYRPPLETEGWGDLQPELNRMSKDGRWTEMADLVDDEILARLTVRGAPHEIAGLVRTRFGDRADRVGFYLPYAAAPDLVAEVVDGFAAPAPT